MTVLVVGAGPTGLTLACELARRDVPVRIVDRAAEYFPGSRGKGLQPRTLEIFDDLDVVDEVFAWGIEGIRIRNYRPDGPPEDVDPQAAAVRTPSVPYPRMVIIPQWRTERILRDRLADFGVRVELGTELVGFEQSDEHVTVTLNGPAGVERVEVDHLAGCDGGRSTVRKALGLDFAGETADSGLMIIADLEVTGLAGDRWHMWLNNGGFLALCPFAGVPTWQLQAVFPPDENGRQPEPSLETFRRAVTELSGMPGIEVANPTWQSTYRVNERMVDRMRVGRVFVAGDAAHVHSPGGGLGMNTGIQDGYNLGWKLAAVHSGAADDTLLDSYQEERLPVAAWTLRTSGEQLRKVAEGAGRGENAFTTPVSDENRQLGLGYRWSGLSRELVNREGLLRSGDRAPDAPCINAAGATVRLFDLFRGPQFTLLGFGAGCADAVRRVALARPGLVGTHLIAPDAELVDGSGDAAEAYGITTDTLVLVRPDGYVAVIADPGDVDAVLDHPGWNRVRAAEPAT